MNAYYDAELTAGDAGRRLTITLPGGRGVMDYQVEMIANNDVGGLLRFRHLTVDGKPCFLYDVNGLCTLEEYLKENRPGIRFVVETLLEISVAIGGLDKYLLEENCLLLEPELIFIEPARRGVKLAYLPTEPPDGKQSPFSEFVLDLIGGFRPEDATGKLYCRRIIEEVKKAGFRYEAFTDFLMDILCFSDSKLDDGASAYRRGAAWRDDGAAAPARGVNASAGGANASVRGAARSVMKFFGADKNTGDKRGAAPRANPDFRRGGVVPPVASESPRAIHDNRRGGVIPPIAGESPRAGHDNRRGGVIPPVASESLRAGHDNRRGGVIPPVANESLRAGHDNRRGGVIPPVTGDRSHDAANGKNLLMPALAATAVAIAYFGIISFIPDGSPGAMTYKSAALVAALGGELLLMKHFIAGGAGANVSGAGARAGGMGASAGIASMRKSGKTAFKRGGEFAEAVGAAAFIREASAAAASAAAGAESGASADLWSKSAGPDDAACESDGQDTAADKPISLDAAADKPISLDAAADNPVSPDVAANKPVSPDAAADKPISLDAAAYKPVSLDAAAYESISPVAVACDSVSPDSVICESTGLNDPPPPDYPQTVLLPQAKQIEATLLVKDEMREFGVALNKNEFTIGRIKEFSDLVLDNPAVGKIHAKIIKEGSGWYVKDIYSRNGTYLNNIKIEYGGSKALKKSDLITVANVDIVFSPLVA